MGLFVCKIVIFVFLCYDIFNLVVLEFLFFGCFIVVGGGVGVCCLFKEDFFDVFFVEIDLDNIYSCLLVIENILSDYNNYCCWLVDSVKNLIVIVDSFILVDIY